MHETARSIIRFYILCAIWLAVALGMTFAALGPVDVALTNVVETNATFRASTALAIGLLTGSLVTFMLWASFPIQRTRRSAADRRELAHATVLGATDR